MCARQGRVEITQRAWRSGTWRCCKPWCAGAGRHARGRAEPALGWSSKAMRAMGGEGGVPLSAAVITAAAGRSPRPSGRGGCGPTRRSRSVLSLPRDLRAMRTLPILHASRSLCCVWLPRTLRAGRRMYGGWRASVLGHRVRLMARRQMARRQQRALTRGLVLRVPCLHLPHRKLWLWWAAGGGGSSRSCVPWRQQRRLQPAQPRPCMQPLRRLQRLFRLCRCQR